MRTFWLGVGATTGAPWTTPSRASVSAVQDSSTARERAAAEFALRSLVASRRVVPSVEFFDVSRVYHIDRLVRAKRSHLRRRAVELLHCVQHRLAAKISDVGRQACCHRLAPYKLSRHLNRQQTSENEEH